MPPKHDPDSDAVTKILALYTLLLFKGKAYNLRVLSEKLSCSKQTVLRLCTQLEGFAAEFRTEIRGRERWYWLEKPQSRPNLALAPDALKCLAMCRNIAAHLLPKEMLDETEEAIERASMLLSDLGRRAGAMEAPIETRCKGLIDYSGCHENISRLIQAIEGRMACVVAYQKSYDADQRDHHFLPLRIVAHHEALYVEGWSVSDRGAVELFHEMTLAVQRIVNVLITPRAVSLDTDLDWENEVGDFGVMAGDQFRAKVEFTPRAAQYVRERIWSKDQKIEELPDGIIRLEFSAGSADEVSAWVLSFGKEAIVIQPEDLRQRVAEEVRTLSALYSEFKIY